MLHLGTSLQNPQSENRLGHSQSSESKTPELSLNDSDADQVTAFFAEEVVKKDSRTIGFNGFTPVLDNRRTIQASRCRKRILIRDQQFAQTMHIIKVQVRLFDSQ